MKNLKSNHLSSVAAVVLLASAFSAQAALVSPISATTNMGSGFGTNLINTINGVGLSSLSLTATHSATFPNNSWVSANVLSGDITFNLGGTFSIEGLSFWNQNDGGPGDNGITGIKNVVISSSLDNVTFTLIAGAPSVFARESGSVSNAQQFSFGKVNATHVKFSVASNYGDLSNTGFAEVKFNSAAASVPDGGTTVAMLGLSLVGMGYARRKLAK
jgi:hypothetical protein